MLNTPTANQPTHPQKSDRTDTLIRRILKYYDLLPPEAQVDVKRSIAERPLIFASESAIQVEQAEKTSDVTLYDISIPSWSPSAFWNNRFPEDTAWHLQVLLGEAVVNDVIDANGGQLTERAVLSLLTAHPLPLYTDADEKLLFMGINKLAERELGPLKPISSTLAAIRYGLAKLEEASEKSYTRL